MWRNMKEFSIVTKILLYLVLCVIAIVALFPLLWAISASLRTDTELYKYTTPLSINTFIPVKFTLESYITIFTDFNFSKPILNTILLIAIIVPSSCIVNSIAAFSFATFNFKFKAAIFSLFIISFMVPFESIAIPLYNVVNKFGWVDTRLALIVPGIASGLVLFLFTQFFKDIPPSLIEAARIDGASWLTVYGKIIMPSSIPVTITAGLMIFMDQWNAYLWPLLVARDKEIRTIQIALSSFKLERGTLWSCLYAGSIISALIPIALFLPFQKYFVQGVLSSGVKG